MVNENGVTISFVFVLDILTFHNIYKGEIKSYHSGLLQLPRPGYFAAFIM